MITAAQNQWPCASAASSSIHLALNPPLGGMPISDRPLTAKVRATSGNLFAKSAEIIDPVMAQRLGHHARRHEHRGLGEGMRHHLHPAARPRRAGEPRFTRCRRHQREDEEHVADLRHRRIGDQQLEPRLGERRDAAEDHRRGTERGEELHRRGLADDWQGIEPQPHEQEQAALHHQRGEHRTSRRGCARHGRAEARGGRETAPSSPEAPRWRGPRPAA